LFAGIHKLPPGSFLAIDAKGQHREERYWDVLDHTAPLTGVSEEEIAERLLSELRTSVALRTVSDVPVGVFLSGGHRLQYQRRAFFGVSFRKGKNVFCRI